MQRCEGNKEEGTPGQFAVRNVCFLVLLTLLERTTHLGRISQFSHASGLGQSSNLVRWEERGKCPGMEELLLPWSLGSSVGEAVLQESLDCGGSLQELVSWDFLGGGG